MKIALGGNFKKQLMPLLLLLTKFLVAWAASVERNKFGQAAKTVVSDSSKYF
jgi:hypothetical protein